MTKKIIIDCDPGIDDTLALLYALKHPDLEVVAITIVAGNCPTELGVKNAFTSLELLNRLDIPIYKGADAPLKRDYVSAQETHGIDGLGENDFELKHTPCVQPESAEQFLADYFKTAQDTSIIALGPLTNIAKALKINPNLGKHCHRFVSMGGNFKSHGNCSPVAEYNYWCDPHAAQIVFEQLGCHIEMVGLDVTRHIVLRPNHLEYMKHINAEMTELITKITRFYFDFHWEYEHIIGCVINDPLALAHFINGDICSGFDAYTDVVTDGIASGQTIVDQYDFYHKPKNSTILTHVKPSLFWEDFLTVLLDAQKHVIQNDLNILSLEG